MTNQINNNIKNTFNAYPTLSLQTRDASLTGDSSRGKTSDVYNKAKNQNHQNNNNSQFNNNNWQFGNGDNLKIDGEEAYSSLSPDQAETLHSEMNPSQETQANFYELMASKDGFKLGHNLFGQCNYAQAINFFDKFEKNNPLFYGAQVSLGDCYFCQNDYSSAIKHFATVPENHPMFDLAQASINRAKLQQNASDPSSRSTDFQSGCNLYQKGDYTQAIKLFGHFEENDPLFYDAQYFLGSCHLKQKSFAEATKCFNSASKSNSSLLVARAMFGLGISCFSQGNYDVAINHLMIIPINHEKYDEAQNTIRAAQQQLKRLSPQRNDVNNNELIMTSNRQKIQEGNILMEQKNYPRAMLYFSSVPRSDTPLLKLHFVHAQIQLGCCYAYQGNYDLATRYFWSAQFHDVTRQHSALIELNLGCFCFHQKNYIAAMDHFVKVREDHKEYNQAQSMIKKCSSIVFKKPF